MHLNRIVIKVVETSYESREKFNSLFGFQIKTFKSESSLSAFR